MVSHPQGLDSAGVLASEDHPRSHSRFEIQISNRLSFPSFETAIQKEPSAPFWHKPAWPLIKIGWIRLDSVGFNRIGFDSQMGSFGKNHL